MRGFRPGIPELDDLQARQAAVLSRAQALACGMGVEQVRALLRSGRWQRMGRGVYATFSGEPSRVARLWAAVLEAGRGATLSHHTAAQLHGLIDKESKVIHISVPVDRRLRPAHGRVVHLAEGLEAARHPT